MESSSVEGREEEKENRGGREPAASQKWRWWGEQKSGGQQQTRTPVAFPPLPPPTPDPWGQITDEGPRFLCPLSPALHAGLSGEQGQEPKSLASLSGLANRPAVTADNETLH